MRPSRTGDVTPSNAWAPVSSPPFIPQKDDPTTYHLSSPPSDLTSPPPRVIAYAQRPKTESRPFDPSIPKKDQPNCTPHTLAVRWYPPEIGIESKPSDGSLLVWV